ncbi:hypothetical protein, partial [Vibrio parahaemolyticus]|uniref:hypothetical protein n=1 Tax=Vibrio parahaemolyticus TaxID=670 RepID=UPI001C5EBF66
VLPSVYLKATSYINSYVVNVYGSRIWQLKGFKHYLLFCFYMRDCIGGRGLCCEKESSISSVIPQAVTCPLMPYHLVDSWNYRRILF